MDNPCGEIGDCSSSVLVLSFVQTDRQTDADERFTPATLVGVSNDKINARICKLMLKRYYVIFAFISQTADHSFRTFIPIIKFVKIREFFPKRKIR